MCENGFTKKKVMMHAEENYKLETVSDFTDLHCKVAYKVSVNIHIWTGFMIATE